MSNKFKIPSHPPYRRWDRVRIYGKRQPLQNETEEALALRLSLEERFEIASAQYRRKHICDKEARSKY